MLKWVLHGLAGILWLAPEMHEVANNKNEADLK